MEVHGVTITLRSELCSLGRGVIIETLGEIKVLIQKDPILAALAAPTHTLSDIKGLEVGAMADLFKTHGGPVVISVSAEIDPGELVVIDLARGLSGVFVQIVNETEIMSSAAKRMTRSLINFSRGELDGYFIRIPAEMWVREWNEFVFGHAVSAAAQSPAQLHFHSNLGTSGDEELMLEVGVKLRGMTTVRNHLLPILIQLKPHQYIVSEEEILDSLMLAMLSNAVRGLLYWSRGVPQTYPPRKEAIEHFTT